MSNEEINALKSRVNTLELRVAVLESKLLEFRDLAVTASAAMNEQRLLARMTVLSMIKFVGSSTADVTKAWYELRDIAERLE